MKLHASVFSTTLSVLILILPSTCKASPDPGLRYFEAGQFAEAALAWRAEAEAGDALAALYLGVAYDTGEGVPRSAQTAARWYAASAARGNAAAALNLGVLYDGGGPAMRDPQQAIGWYRYAASLGSARAAYNLGLIYQQGLGTLPDHGLAAQYFGQAAGQGLAAARTHLAALHARQPPQRRTERDVTLDAFEQAQRTLLARGAGGMANAFELFRRAANVNPLAAYDLAYCYENGLGTPRDWAAALHWYRQAGTLTRDSRLHELARAGADALQTRLTSQEQPTGLGAHAP